MAQLSFKVSDELQTELEQLFKATAKEVLSELSSKEVNSKPYMNLKETAEYVGCSFVTLNGWIHDRGLQVIKIGGKKYIAKETIDRFMMNHQK